MAAFWKSAAFRESLHGFLSSRDIGFPFWFIIPGLIGTVISFTSMQYAEESKDWPAVRAIVISSKLERQQSSTGDKHSSYKPRIEYEYTVGEKTFRSQKLSFSYTSFSDRKEALAIQEKYSTGQRITVYYKPDNPSMAVLERGGDIVLPPLVVGIGFLVVGCLDLLIALLNRLGLINRKSDL